ncbi:LysR family transcriptional regulator [Staphylococcus carnosus]|uniref:LysR family transcriptional regulator n=1 Tax=Staphylococcus carnosus TaxID=1281 RepID=A0AAJ0NHH8_STACA|nr:LysR family transcriptional regulator [Staphylococcus carnosus]ANZ34589.1 LysR family transcriptional regulator [Staphylococcus carnosus]KKB25695.1 LysR family transcriptional regulator [Staphylococcus carnosus]POA00634.1 LysR family transcriptional regulator [Staphylococcus carnosus]QQS84202.1 LysR family transcriptional regulator [Staphylococcus carnosus]QRQ04142.1 LysR family transcriptional regulator [Staphylococcus carnosus]
MNIKQLMIFKQFVEDQNVNVVAEKLNITQPTVTFHLKNLSETHQVPLYHKKGKLITLTKAGQILYQNSSKILTLIEETESILGDYKTSKRGGLRIGSSHAPIYGMLPEALKTFMTEYPDIDISLEVDTAPQTVEKVKNREVEIGVISENGIRESEVEVKRLFDDPLMLAMDKSHPLALSEHISIKDIQSYPLIIHSSGSTKDSIDEWQHTNLIQINPVMQSNSMSSLIETIRNSHFISLLSSSAVNHPDIIAKPIPHSPAERHISIVYKSDREINPIMQNFISTLYQLR